MDTASSRHRQPKLGALASISIGVVSSLIAAHSAAEGVTAAARDGDVAAVRAQLASGADVNAAETDGTTALLWATYQGSPELVKLLLDAGAEPNVPNKFGVTPLLQSSRIGDVDTLRGCSTQAPTSRKPFARAKRR